MHEVGQVTRLFTWNLYTEYLDYFFLMITLTPANSDVDYKIRAGYVININNKIIIIYLVTKHWEINKSTTAASQSKLGA